MAKKKNVINIERLIDAPSIPKFKKPEIPKKEKLNVKKDTFKEVKQVLPKAIKVEEPVKKPKAIHQSFDKNTTTKSVKTPQIKEEKERKKKKPNIKNPRVPLTEEEKEYRRVRSNLQSQISRAKKFHKPTVEMPEMLRRGASDLEVDVEIQKLEQLKEIQSGYIRDIPTIGDVEDDERDDYYSIYVESFLSRVYELDYVSEKDNIHGSLVITDFIESCIDRAGYKATANMIKAATDSGLVITWEKKYTDVAKEFVDEMAKYLGIDLPIEEQEAIDEYRDSLSAAFDYENDYIW